MYVFRGGGLLKDCLRIKRFDFCILGGAVDIYISDIEIIRMDSPCGFTPIPVSAPLIDII